MSNTFFQGGKNISRVALPPLVTGLVERRWANVIGSGKQHQASPKNKKK